MEQVLEFLGEETVKITGFDPDVFEPCELDLRNPDGSRRKKNAHKCRYCGKLYVGPTTNNRAFAHTCKIPGGEGLTIRIVTLEEKPAPK